MRTLKKVLALTLVFALAFTMMAGATVFSDDSSIDAQDQVDLIYALGVIAGYPDGTFRPSATITRAEAAKMLYVMKTGKDEGSANYTNAAKPFTDTVGHWAEGYINYCYLNGIIAGVGNGKFDPEGTITGAQLAKMCLTLMGYDANKANLVGPNWLTNTMSLAFENKLFDDYKSDVAASAPRQDAAVLFYNTTFTPIVVFRDGVYTSLNVLGRDNPTVGTTNFNLVEYEGVLVAAQGMEIGDLSAADDEIVLDDVTRDGNRISEDINDVKLDYDGGKDFLGQKVKVVYDEIKEKVYNIVPTGKNKVYTVAAGDIEASAASSGKDIKFGDKDYELKDAPGGTGTKIADAESVLYINYKEAVGGDNAPIRGKDNIKAYLDGEDNGNMVKLVDHNDDKKIDYIFVIDRTFGYVDSVDSKQITMAGESVKFLNDDDDKQIVGADSIKEGDYVIYYYDELDEIYYVEKATSISATVDGKRGTGNLSIRVNGSFMDPSDLFDEDVDNGDADQDELNVGDKYTIFTDGDYWIAAVSEEDSLESAGNYVYIINSQKKKTGLEDGQDPKAEVMIPGEDDPVIYVIDRYNEAGTGDKIDLDDDKIDDLGGIAAYSITSNGKIRLSQDIDNMSNTTTISYNADSDTFSTGVGGMMLADDAVVFYKRDNNGGKIEILGNGDFDTTFTGASGKVAYKESGKNKYIKVAYIEGDMQKQNGAGSDRIYAYVTSDSYEIYDKDADKNYVAYDVYVDGKNTTVRLEDGDNTGSDKAEEGDVISYKLKANGDMKDDTLQINTNIHEEDETSAYGRITAYNSSRNKVTIETAPYNPDKETGELYSITKDTVTLYVDNDNSEGTTGSSYPRISKTDAKDHKYNCFFVCNDKLEVVFILVDTSATLENPEDLAPAE